MKSKGTASRKEASQRKSFFLKSICSQTNLFKLFLIHWYTNSKTANLKSISKPTLWKVKTSHFPTTLCFTVTYRALSTVRLITFCVGKRTLWGAVSSAANGSFWLLCTKWKVTAFFFCMKGFFRLWGWKIKISYFTSLLQKAQSKYK